MKIDMSFADDKDLAEQFLEWTDKAVKVLRTASETLADGKDTVAETIDAIYSYSHNIKGMGASFDYSLLSSVGASLCAYLKDYKPGDLVSHRVIKAHVRAFEVIMQNRISGTGGAQGSALTQRLSDIVAEEGALGSSQNFP